MALYEKSRCTRRITYLNFSPLNNHIQKLDHYNFQIFVQTLFSNLDIVMMHNLQLQMLPLRKVLYANPLS